MTQQTIWNRLSMKDSLDLTIESLNEYGPKYDHWVLAFSGGKDSTATATLVAHLIEEGRIPAPKSLRVMYADTRMELPPLADSALRVMAEMVRRGISCEIVTPALDQRFWVYMLGRGVPPPKNRFRWCTPSLKIEQMTARMRAHAESHGQRILVLTGVRLGESAARDQRISVSCSKDGAECGQGWFQVGTPGDVGDTLAPLLHWRVCHVWNWLRHEAPQHGFPTGQVATAYGGEEAEEINARTGCVGCPLTSRDVALEAVIRQHGWEHLAPLRQLRAIHSELWSSRSRLRKDGSERRQDGSMVKNPMRMGPLTMEARLWALGEVSRIQDAVNSAAPPGRGMTLIDEEERARILDLIRLNTWPRRWTGEEQKADQMVDEVLDEGVIQPLLPGLFGGSHV